MNYRLAPDHQWPAGGEDVLAAFDWLKVHAASHGGDPERIFVMGTSAGSVHVATALKLRPDLAARGLILLSGIYGYTDPDPRDLDYMGDAALYQQRMPKNAVIATELPLLIATAEHDPERFQREFAELTTERLAQHDRLPQLHYGTGHNHYTLAMHLGTSDTVLADSIARFIARCCAGDGQK
jgi:acetyl esterase/lipase